MQRSRLTCSTATPPHRRAIAGALPSTHSGRGGTLGCGALPQPGVQRPYLRGGFRHPDLRVWAKGERHRLIWAALTLVLHWVARGRPVGTRLLGSYEGYCRVIGGILQAGGIDGFLADLRAEQDRCDDETAEWTVFVAAWRDRFGDERVTAQHLDEQVLTPNPDMLAVALASTSSRRGRRIKLGQELRNRRDAVLAGYRVRVSDTMDRHGCWHYRLETADTGDAANLDDDGDNNDDGGDAD